MATCIKRSVLQAGNRPARIQAAASALQAAANQAVQRVAPHAGSGMPMGPVSHAGRSGNTLPDIVRALAKAIDQFARDVSDAMTQQAAADRAAELAASSDARMRIYVVYQPYAEPMSIPLPTDFTVAAISCARAVYTASPNTVLINGSTVEWDVGGSDIIVRSIDGMTPSAAVITFTFVYFGV